MPTICSPCSPVALCGDQRTVLHLLWSPDPSHLWLSMVATRPSASMVYSTSELWRLVELTGITLHFSGCTDGGPLLDSHTQISRERTSTCRASGPCNGSCAWSVLNIFSSVYIDEPEGPLPDTIPVNTEKEFSPGEITVEAVKKLLRGLDPSKVVGPDEVHPAVLKEPAHVLAVPVPFQKIYRCNITTVWKAARAMKGWQRHSNTQEEGQEQTTQLSPHKVLREWLIDLMWRTTICWVRNSTTFLLADQHLYNWSRS